MQEYYVGMDVSLKLTSVCIVDANGKVAKETKVETHPDSLVAHFQDLHLPVSRIGLEAGPLSQWLHAGLTQAGFETVLLETRHVKAALSAMTVKTDRKDARGIAQLLRMGWFRPVHPKSIRSQEMRALLVARKLLQNKLKDVELSIRGILRGFGLKVGKVTRKMFERRIRQLVTGHAMLERIAEAMLSARGRIADPVQPTRQSRPLDRSLRQSLRTADDGAKRRRIDGHHLQVGDRRPASDQEVQGRRATLRIDAEEVPVRRDGRHHRNHAGW
jgi:transposase